MKIEDDIKLEISDPFGLVLCERKINSISVLFFQLFNKYTYFYFTSRSETMSDGHSIFFYTALDTKLCIFRTKAKSLDSTEKSLIILRPHSLLGYSVKK